MKLLLIVILAFCFSGASAFAADSPPVTLEMCLTNEVPSGRGKECCAIISNKAVIEGLLKTSKKTAVAKMVAEVGDRFCSEKSKIDFRRDAPRADDCLRKQNPKKVPNPKEICCELLANETLMKELFSVPLNKKRTTQWEEAKKHFECK